MRTAQNVFVPGQYKDVIKTKPAFFDKHFYQWKNNLFRKGFIYKPFSLKQIDSQSIRPTSEERQ